MPLFISQNEIIMNLPEAKKIPIVDYLETKGFQPKKIYPGAAWFNSPLREETEPSFKVHLRKNVWFDFGTGEGGNIIDLINRLEQCETREALKKLPQAILSFDPNRYKNTGEPGKIEIKEVRPVTNDALIQYIDSRSISLQFAIRYLKECKYSVYGRQFFALAFQNDKGGYELRSKFFKGSCSPKYITTFKGEGNAINIFEGVFDFLSSCTYYNRSPKNTSIILNSLSFLPKILPDLRGRTLHLFLDNDSAGKKAVKTISEKINQVTDYSAIVYPDHKDFNEFIIKSNSTSIH
jgi:DNA primase